MFMLLTAARLATWASDFLRSAGSTAVGRVALLAVVASVASTGLAVAEEPAPAAVAPPTAVATPPAAVAEPLHRRIDAEVERVAIGPLAPTCGDADFVRRVYLDLTGIIPPPEKVKEFLADPAPGKRTALIDALIDSPEFSRHFAVQLDVLLLDRRNEKYVDRKVWESYLIDAIVRRKPLDQMFREFIAPDITGSDATAARKFLLTSTVEPHAMTRDVGRILFGMDLQCAQCHDHPLISDYHQEDYYGLFAFLNRTSLFEDPASKAGILAEKPDGEAAFESVFTGTGKPLMQPRVPRGATLYVEPKLTGDEAFKVKPDKDHAAKPVFSRREALAKMLADSTQFRRNLANRLWSLLIGRGLVHPTDFHYADNPPVNPPLLTLLATDLAQSGFDLRHFVREVLLSRTYQRDCVAPRPETINLADIRSRKASLSGERETWLAGTERLRGEVTMARGAWQEAVTTNEQVASELAPLETKLTEARSAATTAETAQQETLKALDQWVARATPIETVLAATKTALEQISDEPVLTQSLAALQARSGELATAIAAAKTAHETQTAMLTQARAGVTEIESAVLALAARKLPSERLVELEQTHLALATQLQDTDATRRLVDAQLALCDQMLEYPAVAQADALRAEAVWQAIVDRWSLCGQVAPLKPLTPEQLAASAMRATGYLAHSEAAAKAALEKTPPTELADANLPEAEKSLVMQVALQAALLEQLRGNVNQFVGQFGGLSGEEFQATVNQALFLGNSPTVNQWLTPGGDTLIGRLKDQADTDALADELSMAVLSRPATVEERSDFAQFLSPPAEPAAAPPDRAVALGEWVWALITSNEFRFNH